MPEPWADRLRAGLHDAVDGWTPTHEQGVRRRPRPAARALAVAAAVLLVAGVAAAVAVPLSGSHPAAVATILPAPADSPTTSLPVCGPLPATTRPDLDVTVNVAGVAISGTTVQAIVAMRPVGTAAVDIVTGQPADLLIVSAGQVVGRYEGLVGGTGFEGTHVTRDHPLTLPPTELLLSGCPTLDAQGHVDGLHPDATRRPLPPGDYELVAVADGGIVSAPAPLAILGPGGTAARSPAVSSTDGTGCGPLPVDTHPEILASLVVPGSGVGGATVSASVELRPAAAGSSPQLESGGDAQLYILQAGRVVGADLRDSYVLRQGSPTTEKPEVFAQKLTLALGCDGRMAGAPLPPGGYELVGAVDGAYVSAPVPFTVTSAVPPAPGSAPTTCTAGELATTIGSDQRSYPTGQKVVLTRTVSNHGAAACYVTSPQFAVLDAHGQQAWGSICGDPSGHELPFPAPPCPEPATVLAAGASHTDHQTWDRTEDGTAGWTVQPAPAGTYRAVADDVDGRSFTLAGAATSPSARTVHATTAGGQPRSGSTTLTVR